MFKQCRYIFITIALSTLLISCASSSKTSSGNEDNYYEFVKSKSQQIWNYDKEQRQEIAKDLYIRGLTDYYDEKYVSAILYFETALKYEQNPTLNLMLAECYMQIRDVDNALDNAIKVFLQDTNNTRALQLMFSGFILKNDILSAEKTINYIQNKDQSIENTSIMAEFYTYTNPQKAIELLDNLYFRTENPEYLYKSIDLLEKTGDYKKSIEQTYNFLKKKFDYDFFIKLFYNSLNHNYIDYLIKYYEELYPYYDNEGKLNSANYFLDLFYDAHNKDVDSVLKSFVDKKTNDILADCIKFENGNIENLNFKAGFVALDKGDTNLAVNFFEKYLNYCDTCRTLSKYTANLCNYIGKTNKAIDISKKFYEKFPNDSTFLLDLGYHYFVINEYNTAIKYFLEYFTKDSSNLLAISSLADLNSKINNHKEAEKYYLMGLKIDPENATLNNNYAYLLTNKKERLLEAKKFAEIALQQEPDNGAYLDTYGWIHFKMGNYEKAKEYLEKAKSTGLLSAEIYEHLYEVNLKLGFYNEAIINLQNALMIDPNNADYKKKLKELEKKIKK